MAEHTPEDAPLLEGGRRGGTVTSSFGVGRRESHDAAAFYARFEAPEIIESEDIGSSEVPDPFLCADARHMEQLEDNSVALVVTSPPYFAGKEYELALGEGHVPASYGEYLKLLADVFAQCKKKLEPGGRIAVNVANLGRRPFRNLAADVTRILEELKLLMRGEIVWRKAQGASGSCAWGSYRSPSNPVLRDTTERVIVASKWRFDRAMTSRKRGEQGRPHRSTLSADEFMEATLDLWEIPPENATRVGHPAPFPVELPQRLIELYTYAGDLVMDPFMGAGSTLVAAARTGRRYVGYDVEQEYVDLARSRVTEEEERLARLAAGAKQRAAQPLDAPLAVGSQEEAEVFHAEAVAAGKKTLDLAERTLRAAGFDIVSRNKRLRGVPLSVPFVVTDQLGGVWHVDVSGGFTATRPGLRRVASVWKALGRAHVLRNRPQPGDPRLILLTSHMPAPRSEGDRVLRSVGLDGFFDAVAMLSPVDRQRLSRYAHEGAGGGPLLGFWTEAELLTRPVFEAPPRDRS